MVAEQSADLSKEAIGNLTEPPCKKYERLPPRAPPRRDRAADETWRVCVLSPRAARAWSRWRIRRRIRKTAWVASPWRSMPKAHKASLAAQLDGLRPTSKHHKQEPHLATASGTAPKCRKVLTEMDRQYYRM
ncbi:unnamed protein product [Prorocentrum cordatum]|uniref:Uncharacterized protein n=1 Tax=Prorocentrum cordatum TaxID=2364126 RepID=A0ABN9SJU7_9DINO|nr:unnamed protein product [Polarella glacialis]